MAGKITRKKKKSGFVILDTTCLKDKNLSFKAKGLHSYLMQLPDDWEINISDLKNRSKDGRDSVSAAMNELIAAGYVRRQLSQSDKGIFEGYDYEVFERPENALSVNGKSVNGSAVNGKSVTIKDYSKLELNEESINKGETKKDVSQNLEDSHSTQKENVPPPPAAKFPAAWVALIEKAAKRPPAKMQHSSERVWKIEMPDEIAAELLECSKDALFMEQFKRTAGRKPTDTVMDLFTAFLDRRLIEGEGGYQNKKEFRRHLLNFPAKYILATQNRPEPPKQQPKQNAPQIPILR